MKDEKSGVMGMEIMEFGRVVLAMLRVEIGGRMTMVMMLSLTTWCTIFIIDNNGVILLATNMIDLFSND